MGSVEPDGSRSVRAGSYHLVDRIAIGGMAEVFLAVDGRIDGRLVVVKRLLPHLAHDTEFVRAFAREATYGTRLRHPNVVAIHEFGAGDGLPFLAMEYMAGSTLRELLTAASDARRRIPIDAAVAVILQVCAGAHAAHELTDDAGRPYGLVHRDLTPHNLMIDDTGRVKLLDFGIAKVSDGLEQTRTGVLKGKIAYMSPEQCRQDALDRRSDVFSLGVVAYQLLTGDKPFRGSSELGTMQAIVSGRHAPLRTVRPEVPLAVAAAVERAMAHLPDERFPTAAAFAQSLDAAARDAGMPPDPERLVALVAELLGESHARKRAAVAEVLAERRDRPPDGVDVPLVTESLEAVASPTRPQAPPAPQRRPVGAALGGLAALVIVALTLVWVGRTTAPAGPVPLDGAAIDIALAPTMDPDGLRTDFEPIRRFLEDTLDRPVAVEVRASYRDAADAVARGRVPYAVLPPQTAARAASIDPRVRVVAVKEIDGSAASDGFLLVRRVDALAAPTDLRGRTVCFTDAWSATGSLLPTAFLRAAGVDVDRDVQIHWSGNHDQALRDLLAGTCDAAATFSGNYETAAMRGIPTAQLRILAITGSTPHDALVAGPSADPAATEALEAALLAYPGTPEGSPRATERVTGWVRPPADRGAVDPR